MKILVNTRTPWHEPPRMRKQFSLLLQDLGHEIHYLNINNSFKRNIYTSKSEEIFLYEFGEPINFRLRCGNLFNNLNWRYIENNYSVLLNEIAPDLVVNFNIDHGQLNDLFDGPVIQFLNDHFLAQAMNFMKKQVENWYSHSLGNSDLCLTISYPLQEVMEKYTNNNVEILFPWSFEEYKKVDRGNDAKRILFFGFIHRFNRNKVLSIIQETDFGFDFVGPVRDKKFYNEAKNFENVKFIPPSNLNELSMDEYFCSFLPYDLSNENNRYISASNRFFQLLSYGLPLVISDLPGLINTPDGVLMKCDSVREYKEAFNYCYSNVNDVQKNIESFLNDHDYTNRKERVHQLIENL